jgi:hypothetical protein
LHPPTRLDTQAPSAGNDDSLEAFNPFTETQVDGVHCIFETRK